MQAASRWNFGFFTTAGDAGDSKLGTVRALQMEFETTVSVLIHDTQFVAASPKGGESENGLGSLRAQGP